MTPVPVNHKITRPATEADVAEPIAFMATDRGLAAALTALVTYRARQTQARALPVTAPQEQAA